MFKRELPENGFVNNKGACQGPFGICFQGFLNALIGFGVETAEGNKQFANHHYRPSYGFLTAFSASQ